jgi:hypothetical protein
MDVTFGNDGDMFMWVDNNELVASLFIYILLRLVNSFSMQLFSLYFIQLINI